MAMSSLSTIAAPTARPESGRSRRAQRARRVCLCAALVTTAVRPEPSLANPLLAEPRSATPSPPAQCPVVDIMPSFWAFWAQAQHMDARGRAERFKALVIGPHAELYTRPVLGLPETMSLDDALTAFLKRVDSLVPTMHALTMPLRDRLRTAPSRFVPVFPDFTCSMPLYIMPSLGAFDGGTRTVNGKPALLFGLDVLADVDGPIGLQSLVDHELFHVYHAHVLVGDSTPLDDANRPIYESLWEEGLATYTRHVLDPQVPLHLVLGQPSDLAERARPLLPQLTRRLRAVFDSTSDTFNAEFFWGPMRDSGPPARGGYYIGYLAAGYLARTRSLSDLAHTPFDRIRAPLADAVARVGTGSIQ
jgi:hypothetical protein